MITYNEAWTFPEGVDSFVQKWNTWESHSELTLRLLKNWLTKFISQVLCCHALTWFQQIQIQRRISPSTCCFGLCFYDSFGKKGEPMTYTIGDNPTQVYYDPANQIGKIYRRCHEIFMDRMIRWLARWYNWWQPCDWLWAPPTARTRLTHMMSDSYASFINAMKDLIGEKYYITINDVNGGNDDKLAKASRCCL